MTRIAIALAAALCLAAPVAAADRIDERAPSGEQTAVSELATTKKPKKTKNETSDLVITLKDASITNY